LILLSGTWYIEISLVLEARDRLRHNNIIQSTVKLLGAMNG
jgi:hypothetical protein